MPKRIVPLSEVDVRKAKATEKVVKKFDGGGLYLLITPSGGKLWRFKYRFGGMEKHLSFGSYPEVTLGDARALREGARKLVANKIDPGEVKKIKNKSKDTQIAYTFEDAAREWYTLHITDWVPSFASVKLKRFEKNLFPWFKDRPVSEITTPELLTRLNQIIASGSLDLARRIRIDCEKIFAYAIASGRAENNPALQLRNILPVPKFGNHPAITDPSKLGVLLNKMDSYVGNIIIKSALLLTPLLFVRPGELRTAEWSEIDFKEEVWNIPESKMKMKKPHIVPLARQSVHILKTLEVLTGKGKYVFPNHNTPLRPLSKHAVTCALQFIGYSGDEVVPHGFRATARTMIRERLKIESEHIEIQLAHLTKAPNGTAYDRVAFLDERKEMMQRWADYLDELRQLTQSDHLDSPQAIAI